MHINQPLLQAYLLASSKQYDEALELLDSDSTLKSDETALELRARILKDKGDLNGAKLVWTNLLKVNPGNKIAQEVLCNITGFRGWLLSSGKYVGLCIGAVAVCLGVFFVGRATKKTVPDITSVPVLEVSPAPVEYSYAVFVVPEIWTTSTTARLQTFLGKNEIKERTVNLFYHKPEYGVVIGDLAQEQGFAEDKIIRHPYSQSPLSVVSEIAEMQDKEL